MNQIPMLDLRLEYEHMKEDIDAAIKKCLEHQKWIFGPEVKELEEKISGYLKVKHCIGTSSGTEALVLSLRALAIKLKGREYFDRSEEIITTPFTFTATGDAILRSGATPVFVDIDPATYNIDVDRIKDYLHLNSDRVVGMLPVHLYGQACNMDEMAGLARKYNLFMVEDIAQAFGGRWKEQKLGSIGTTGAFSFFPSKNLGGFGDAGMVSTSDDGMADLVRMLLKHGGKDKYNVEHVGYNGRLDTLQAAVVLAKFKYIDEFNERRRSIAEQYNKGLGALKGITLPLAHPAGAYHVYHQYTLRTPKRADFQAFLRERGIATMVYYPFPLHKMKVFHGHMKIAGELKNAEAAADEVISLPIEPLQKQEDTDCIIKTIREYCSQ